MPPYYRPWFRRPWRKKRRHFRRRRSRYPFRYFKQREWVRKRFQRRYKKKLKTIKLTQFQPSHIKNAHIRGMFPVFQAGKGHFSNNYSMYRESYVPIHQPGGGGWNIFCFNLNNLFSEHQHMLNWWNVSNKNLNLVKYKGVKLKLYRQENIDWVFTYQRDHPMETSKYHYTGTHPQRMLMFHHKKIVPSYKSAPHKRKPYVKLFIKPPNEMINKWYFQRQFASYNLLMCTAVACDLNYMFINPGAESNNVTIPCLNTKFFKHKNFQYPFGTTGYMPQDNIYLYGVPKPPTIPSTLKQKDIIYLGNSMNNTEGVERGSMDLKTYNSTKWGNPFNSYYMNEENETFIKTKNYTEILKDGGNAEIPDGGVSYTIEPQYINCRYNPLSDTGNGNEIFWLTTTGQESGWDTKPDPDLVMRGFPLWLMLWGWEDWTRRLNKAKKLDDDWVLVIKSSFIKPPLPAYVPLSTSFINGQAPYGKPIEELDILDYKKWHPRWLFQKEAVEDILMSGPSVVKAPTVKNIQAHLSYDFSLKWGGNPAYIETVADPAQQPVYPNPLGNLFTNEIVNPESSIYNQLYDFDIRRDIVTQKALQRLAKDPTIDLPLFTDGRTTSEFTPPLNEKENSQEKTTPKETQTSTENQLQLIQLYNEQLKHRLRNLKLLMQNM